MQTFDLFVFVLILYVLVNIFSVMSGRVFLGCRPFELDGLEYRQSDQYHHEGMIPSFFQRKRESQSPFLNVQSHGSSSHQQPSFKVTFELVFADV